MKVNLHVDGGARGNPGPAAAGVLIREPSGGRVLHRGGYFLGKATNNVAEYTGLILGLERALDIGATEVQIHSDSQLMVRQIQGQYRVKAEVIKPLYRKACVLLDRFSGWEIEHCYREKNVEADRLANLAMDARDDVVLDGGLEAATDGGAIEDSEAVAATPCWVAQIDQNPAGRCPAGCERGGVYRFTDTVAEGFCAYAAEAVFLKRPMKHYESDPREFSVRARCGKCGVLISIKPGA